MHHGSSRVYVEALGKTQPKDQEDCIAGKGGFISLSHYNLVHKFILIPDAKAAVGKEWEKGEKLPAWQMTKVKKKRGHPRGTERAKHGFFASLMDICHLKKFGVGTNSSRNTTVVLYSDVTL